MVLFGGAEEWATVQWERTMWKNVLTNMPYYTFILEMGTVIYVKILVNT
jgi:hypothetical protein